MFKASIFLVAAALITLAYGWVSGIDAVLYASIGFSAVAGLALLASTVADRRKYPRPEARPEASEEVRPMPAEPRAPRRERRRTGSAPRPRAGEVYGGPTRAPLGERSGPGPGYGEEAGVERREPPFPRPETMIRWSEEEEGGQDHRQEPIDPESTPGAGDFRSRLAAALSDPDREPASRSRPPDRPAPRLTAAPQAGQPRPRAEEPEQDWIPIDDLPGMAQKPSDISPARKPRKPRVVEAASAKPTRPRPAGRRRQEAPQDRQPEPEEGSAPAGEPEAGPSAGETGASRPRIRPRRQP